MRNFLAVVIGVVAGNAVFFLVSIIADRAYPTPPELMDPQTPEEVALRVDAAATNGLLLVALGSVFGGFTGGVVGASVATGARICVTAAIAALFSLWGLYSFYVFYPERLWFPLSLLAGFLIFTCLGSLAVYMVAFRQAPR